MILFTSAGFPWISQLKALDIHLESAQLDWRGIDNFFASLFAVSAYAYATYATTDELARLPSWTMWLVGAAVSTVVYLLILGSQRAKERQKRSLWLAVVNFCLYVLIFVMLTTGFSLLRLRSSYLLVDVSVVDVNGKEVSGVLVEFKDRGGASLDQQRTGTDGRYRFYLDRDRSESVGMISWSKDGYQDGQKTLLVGDHLAQRHELKILK